MPIFSLLDTSDDITNSAEDQMMISDDITNSAEDPLVDLLPPCKEKESWSLLDVLHRIRTEHLKYCFINRCPFNLSNCQL